MRILTDQNRIKEINALNLTTIDWDNFIKLVDWHGVPSLVYKKLNRLAENKIPGPVISRLRTHAQRGARRVLLKTSELVHLLKQFDHRGISALSLKGPALAMQTYGDLNTRPVGDLDILVPAAYMASADHLLRQEGYQRTHPDFNLTPRQYAFYKRNNYHFDYYCKKRRISIELHYRYGSNRALFPLKFNKAWGRRQTVRLGGIDVATLSLEHTLMFLCVHGAAHSWLRLFWLDDVARILRSHQTIAWDRQMAQAGRLGVRRVVSEGVILSSLLLNSPLPEPVRTYGQKDKKVWQLVRMAYDRIQSLEKGECKPFMPGYFREKLHDFRLCDDPAYKLYFFLYQIGPSHDEWESDTLPGLLFFLYFFLRPFTWVYRWYAKRTKVYRQGTMGGPMRGKK